MPRSAIRFAIGVAFLAALLARAPAQDKPDKPDKPKELPREEYREFFKTPETVADFWTALQFEMELGRHELAAKLLHGLVGRKPTDEELLRLEEKEGSLSPFLRLRSVPRWSDDKAVHDQAVKDADELAQRINEALQKLLGDKKRIARLIKDLTGDREEKAFAAKELYRSKALAVPQLVEALRPATGEEREVILNLLPRLSRDTVPPLVAALDIPDEGLRLDLIDVFLKRAEPATAADLWYLAGSPKSSPAVRTRATRALAALLARPVDALVPAPLALTREAERYYRHQITFPNPAQVAVWRWDSKELVQGWPGLPTVSASRAEEYFGLRFARQALDIDPAYAPAQEMFLSVALDKAVERAGVDQPLAKASPEVAELLATVNPDLVVRVLDKALADRRANVIVGAVRALGDLKDARAVRPSGAGDPPLVRAINYPDRRVQMAAAEALLRVPAEPSATTAGRVVDVLRRAVAAEPATKGKPKVLVGFATDALNERAAKALQAASYEAVTVRTGREALKRLESAADIDALLIDTALPDPGLPSLLAQLRAGVGYGRLPLWLVLPGETQESLRRQRYELDRRLSDFRTVRRDLVAEKARTQLALERSREQVKSDAIRQQIDLLGQQLTSYGADQETALRAQARSLEQDQLTAPRDRELSLTRLIERYPNVWLLPQSAALTATALKDVLGPQLADSASKPLTDAERKEFAERSLAWLARAARGELPGYDIRPAEGALYAALRAEGLSEEAVKSAVEAVGRLPLPKAQTELSAVVLDAKRPVAVRSAAAAALQRHVQQHTSALTAAQVRALENLVAEPNLDAGLRTSVALVIGSTRPDARVTGERLKGFDPRPKPAPKDGKGAEPKDEK